MKAATCYKKSTRTADIPISTPNPDSYEPLEQIRDWTTEDGENQQQTHYFHCDQIGILREMTDKDGNLLWYGECTAWGRLKKDEWVYKNAHSKRSL